MLASPRIGRTRPAGAVKPIVPVILPKTARVIVCNAERDDEFGVLEAQFRWNPDLHRIAEFARQYLIGKGESHDRLRVQRRRHVDARVISVSADEPDIFRGEIGSDPLEKNPKRTAAPFADPAPALTISSTADTGRSKPEPVAICRSQVATRVAKYASTARTRPRANFSW
jgi:hypothetical protein